MQQVSRRPWFILVSATTFAIALPMLLTFVNEMGHHIPVFDRGNDYLKGVIVAALLAVSLFAFPVPLHDRKNLLLLWGAKAAVSLVLMLFYEWNYELDAYWYYERAMKHFPDYGALGFGQGTDNLVAALWFFEHKVISLGSYHVEKVFCSYLGLIAIYLFYLGIATQVKNLAPRALLYLGLFPSVLFWSSILGKDPLNLLGSSLFFYGAFSFMQAWNPLFLLPAAVGLLLTALIRTWLAPMLVVPLLIGATANIRSRFVRGLAIAFIIAGLLAALHSSADALSQESEELLLGVNQMSRSWNRGGSAGTIPELNSYGAMLRFLPIGMFTALFRPLPGEVLNAFGLLAGLENVLILVLLFLSVRRPARKAWDSPVVIALGSFILIWAMSYAFISPQNLGSAVRFRLQVMPMMIFVLLYVPKVVRQLVISSPRERRNSTENT